MILFFIHVHCIYLFTSLFVTSKHVHTSTNLLALYFTGAIYCLRWPWGPMKCSIRIFQFPYRGALYKRGKCLGAPCPYTNEASGMYIIMVVPSLFVVNPIILIKNCTSRFQFDMALRYCITIENGPCGITVYI